MSNITANGMDKINLSNFCRPGRCKIIKQQLEKADNPEAIIKNCDYRYNLDNGQLLPIGDAGFENALCKEKFDVEDYECPRRLCPFAIDPATNPYQGEGTCINMNIIDNVVCCKTLLMVKSEYMSIDNYEAKQNYTGRI